MKIWIANNYVEIREVEPKDAASFIQAARVSIAIWITAAIDASIPESKLYLAGFNWGTWESLLANEQVPPKLIEQYKDTLRKTVSVLNQDLLTAVAAGSTFADMNVVSPVRIGYQSKHETLMLSDTTRKPWGPTHYEYWIPKDYRPFINRVYTR